MLYIPAMPRIARIIAPGYPHHVTQRGNNRAQVFFDDEDRRMYLRLLGKYARLRGMQIWAYCLMDNHVHLLVVPGTEQALARGIGLTNQVYTQYLNRKLSQSGRIWQNRFFSCVVENEQSLWAVARYIECNPVKAGMVEQAEGYFWSSARAHLSGADDPVLNGASTWLEDGELRAYAEFVHVEDEESNERIRQATRTGRPFGSEGFVDMLESRLQQTLRPRRPGRPRKE
jgi:putative transposase